MTTQDLKNNRETILSKMNEIGVHENMIKKFMSTMVDFIECGINESENPIDLVYQIFTMNSLRTKEWKGKILSEATLRREYLATKDVERREKMRSQGRNELQINRSI